MRTVLLGPRPPELERLIERRRALGQDLYDEVWEGEYHMAPAPHGRHAEVDNEIAMILGQRAKQAGLRGRGPANIGTPNDYRVPDRSYFADPKPQAFHPTAEVVIEIVSPDDESRNKFDFYYRRGVKEIGIVDPALRSVQWFVRDDAGYRPADRSTLLDISASELVQEIDWPE